MTENQTTFTVHVARNKNYMDDIQTVSMVCVCVCVCVGGREGDSNEFNKVDAVPYKRS